MRTTSRREAFTLIEAILAVAIMGVSAIAIMTAASRCLSVARNARDRHTAAAALDMGEMEYPLVVTGRPADMEVSPVVYMERFAFSRSVTEIGEEEEGVYVVKTRVAWSARNAESSEEVETLVFNTNRWQ